MDYNLFREIADSWGLLYLFAFFLGAILVTFRPGSRAKAEHIAQIPFKEDDTDV